MKTIILVALLAAAPLSALAEDEYGSIGKADTFCRKYATDAAFRADVDANPRPYMIQPVPKNPAKLCADLRRFHKDYNAYEADPSIWQGKIPVSQDYVDLAIFDTRDLS